MPHTPQDVHKKLLGKSGEAQAVAYLKKKGYKIVKQNYSTPFGEADIVAKYKDELVFVEVKTRASLAFGSPKEAVTRQKQARYYKIAQYYGLQSGEEPNARFDVIEVFEDGEIVHIENAF